MKRFLILLLILIFPVCGPVKQGSNTSSHSFNYKGNINGGRWLKGLKVYYTSEEGKKMFTLAQIYFPEAFMKGENYKTIILLHGYGFNHQQWERRTGIERYADVYNIVLVSPNMGKTVYETKFYKETVIKWGGIPGGRFVGEVLINYLRSNFALAYDRSRTGIMGVSTGARGAMLVAAKYPEKFAVAAGLSGYYDHISLSKNKQLMPVYAEYENYKERWENDDNIMKLASNLKNTSVILYHGKSDHSVPKEQSLILAMKVRMFQKKSGSSSIVRYKEKKYAGHDWEFWNKVLKDVMGFFNANFPKRKIN